MKFGTRWPPVPAGILIGISMLLAFVVAGRGIGASGAMTRPFRAPHFAGSSILLVSRNSSLAAKRT